MDFPTTRYPYGFSDHLLHLFFYLYFTISSANGSQQVSNYFCHLSLSIIIALPASPKFRQLLFSSWKVWGYPTSLLSWFIDFKFIHHYQMDGVVIWIYAIFFIYRLQK